ncbi:MAG: hypothetical protein ACXWWR_02760 [Candidatus Limnocylindrales bacterium]
MGFQVEPQRVARRRSALPGILTAIAGLAIVAVGLANGGGSAPSPSRTAAATAGPSSASSIALGVAQRSAVATPRPYPAPSAIHCHGTSVGRCSLVVIAAVGQLPSDVPPVEAIAVWDSILCGSDADCPSSRFRGYRPLGSAIVSFGPDQPRAWVNVVEPAPHPGRVWVPTDIRAWIIRWGG